jgi:hypothetical protein
MKALSVRQPWAWALLKGPKRIENRTWSIAYRGVLLIHASRRPCPRGLLLPDGTPVPDQLDYGALCGIMTLLDCRPTADVESGPFVEGPFCWLLDYPRPFAEPIPYRGQLGLFEVPDELLPAP